MVSGPFAGQILGDLGAEVIKVEMPGGDPMRGLHPMYKGQSAYFSLYNRNKKSLVLNLKSEGGRDLAHRLIDTADVVIENFRPGTMEKLGLGYERLQASNPKLVYAGLSGFGLTGPYAGKPAYDHVIQGMSGLMPYIGTPEAPQPIQNIIADKVASVICSNAVLAALLFRHNNDGKGQRVSVSLMKSFGAFVLPDLLGNHYYQSAGLKKMPNIKVHYPLATKDGHVIGHIQLDHHFENLCRMFGREDLLADERFATPWARISNYEEMWQEFSGPAAGFTTAEVVAMADQYGIPLGPVNDVEAFLEDPQAIHSESFIDTEDPEFGRLRMAGFFADFDASPASLRLRAPKLGEHSEELLRRLGQSDDEINAARAAGLLA